MKKLLVFALLALAIPSALAQDSMDVPIQDAVAAMPESAEIALYSHVDEDLVGYSTDFSRTAFKLFIEQDFAGPATMVVQQEDGVVQTFVVEVVDGSVMFDDMSFLDVLAEAGYENAEVVSSGPIPPDRASDVPALPEGAIDATIDTSDDAGEEDDGSEDSN